MDEPVPDFEQFVQTHGPGLLRLAFLLSADRQIAEDLVQEALVRVYAKWPTVAQVDHPSAYLRRIVVNEYLSWRRRWHTRNVATVLVPDAPAPDGFAPVDDRAECWHLLGALHRKQRAVIVLRFFADLPDEEIGRLLGCTPGTVRSQASRALAAMRVQPRADAT